MSRLRIVVHNENGVLLGLEMLLVPQGSESCVS